MTIFPPDDVFEYLPHPALYWPARLWAAPSTDPQSNVAYQRTYPPGALPDTAATWEDGPHTLRVPTLRETTPLCRVTVATLPGGARIAIIEDVQEFHTDPLTGLLDRRALHHDLRTETPGSVVLLDIDDFKVVNDTLGHAAGDDVLRALGALLCATARHAGGRAYRLGGDEFLMHTTRPIATAPLEHMQQQFRQAARRLGIDGVGVSIGRAEAPQDGNTIEHLILHADAQLGDHKRDRPPQTARPRTTDRDASTSAASRSPRHWLGL